MIEYEFVRARVDPVAELARKSIAIQFEQRYLEMFHNSSNSGFGKKTFPGFLSRARLEFVKTCL